MDEPLFFSGEHIFESIAIYINMLKYTKPLQMTSHLILILCPWIKHYWPHITDEKMKNQRNAQLINSKGWMSHWALWFWTQCRHDIESKACFLTVSVEWIINKLDTKLSISWTHWGKDRKQDDSWGWHNSDYGEACQELFSPYVTWGKKDHS